jgi:sugar/nucleoside kinase (ribokinase family)
VPTPDPPPVDESAPPDLAVLGDVMVDVSVASGSLAEGGDVHGEVLIHPAGSGANAAVWAAAQGSRTRLFGRVGADLPGRLVAAALADRSVDARLSVDPEARTGAMLVVRTDGERSMVADRGANARLSTDDLPSMLDAGAVLVSGYLLFHPGSEEAAMEGLRRARARFVAVDAASWPLVEAYGRDRFEAATADATVLLANEQEADAAAGGEGVDAWRRLLRAFDLVVVKRGPRGALALGSEGEVEEGVPPVDPVDATGAGDAFDGVLLASLAGGLDLRAAMRRACEAGATAAGSPDTWPPERPT